MVNKELFLRTITGLVFAGAILSSLTLLPGWCFSILIIFIGIGIAIQELPSLSKPTSINYLLLFTFYLWLPFGLMIFMAFNPSYKPYLIVTFLVAFCHDTLAYAGGNILGKHHMAPTISPNKTWEGFFCGFVGTLLALKAYPVFALSGIKFISLGLFLTCIATLGDLFESWLKRKNQVKDTSSLLPGHGGLLDRFDSVIFLSVTIYIILQL